MLRYITLNCGILNLPKVEIDLMLHYLNKCENPYPEAIEFIAGILPINSNNVYTLIRHHGLTLNALHILMNRMPLNKLLQYNKEQYLPTVKHLIKPFISRMFEAIGVDKSCDMFKFLYPEISKVKLSDIPSTFPKQTSSYLDEVSMRYYLHNDTNYSLISHIFNGTPYQDELKYIIPKLTPNTPHIDRILIILIQIGFDVKHLAITTNVEFDLLTLDKAFLLVYLFGIESLNRFDIDINGKCHFNLLSECNKSSSEEYQDLCCALRKYINKRYPLHYDVD